MNASILDSICTGKALLSGLFFPCFFHVNSGAVRGIRGDLEGIFISGREITSIILKPLLAMAAEYTVKTQGNNS